MKTMLDPRMVAARVQRRWSLAAGTGSFLRGDYAFVAGIGNVHL